MSTVGTRNKKTKPIISKRLSKQDGPCVKKNNAHPKIHSSLQAKSYEDGDQRQTERIPANEPKSGKW